jgi:hypothetical protein
LSSLSRRTFRIFDKLRIGEHNGITAYLFINIHFTSNVIVLLQRLLSTTYMVRNLVRS